jgi:nicotinate phosphoribosyltransferase
MKYWVKEYETRNGIVLTDLLGTDCFLKDFNLTYATLFSGVRHDSGDPFLWGRKIIEHYKKLGIDPKTKTLLFSDSLDFAKATAIYDSFEKETNVAFGIGTYLSNDLGVVEPLNIVMKVMYVNGMPAAKLSDVPGKVMSPDNDYVEYLKRCVKWRLNKES